MSYMWEREYENATRESDICGDKQLHVIKPSVMTLNQSQPTMPS